MEECQYTMTTKALKVQAQDHNGGSRPIQTLPMVNFWLSKKCSLCI